MILAEKVVKRGDLVKTIEAWLNGILEEISDFKVKVMEGSGGWIIIMPDEELVRTVIRLQTKIDPISSGRPPYTARVQEITGSRITVEYPNPSGLTVRKALPAGSLAASLGYEGDGPVEFLESAGIFEGAPIILAADMPSTIQLELLAEQIMRGLDRIMILDATVSEIDETINLLGDQIAHHNHLTLSTHILYPRLGARLNKLVEKLRGKFPSGVVIKPLPWSHLAQFMKSGVLSLKELLERIW